ncbi:MAG: hypothetical protein K2Y40_15885 [Reyranella sp.]|nr:hypothetical protein [Reyranella sp.]
MNFRLYTALSAGLFAAACQSPGQQSSNRYAGPAAQSPYTSSLAASEQACSDYGFTARTADFDRCVSRERAARANGRVNSDYAEANLTRDACYSYGLQTGTSLYDRCVGREIDARGYRAEAGQRAPTTYRYDQYGNRIDSEGCRVDANGYRGAPQASCQTP